MKFKSTKSHIHFISRGLLISNDEIILCRSNGADWFFLPGGHVENGESARDALTRELKEEMGNFDFLVTSPIGICENIFKLDENLHQQEINIIFEVKINDKIKIDSLENHIEFKKISRKDFNNYKILPLAIKEGIIEWLDNKKFFFKEI